MPLIFEALRVLRGWFNANKSERTVIVELIGGRPQYRVPSETHPGVIYDVFVDVDGAWICSACEDSRSRHQPCKHIIEVLFRFYPGTIPEPSAEEVQQASKGAKGWYGGARRFPHQPHQYEDGLAESTRLDHAAEKEGERVESLLAEIAWILNKRHPHYGPGRPPLPVGDRVVAIVLREYERKSMRRFRGRMERMEVNGTLDFAPSRTTYVSYNVSEDTTVALTEAFELAASVYTLMETRIIADSTGRKQVGLG